MRSSFFGLELGLRALLAQQRALDIIGHNIANSATPGYSRQKVELETTEPYGIGLAGRGADAGLIGTGVLVSGIARVRIGFLDRQYRQSAAGFGDAGARRTIFEALEAEFGEPGDSTLRAALDRFWNSAQEVALAPEGLSARAAMWESAVDLVHVFNLTYSSVSDQRLAIDERVRSRASELNSLVEEAYNLDRGITQVRNAGDNPNDLYDKLDLILDRMSELAGARAVAKSSGASAIYIGGMMVADEWGFTRLEVVDDPANGNLAELRWTGNAGPAELPPGELAALLDLRDGAVKGHLDDLDAMVQALVQTFNAVHRAGFGLDGSTGLDFFDPASVGGGMALNAAVGADLRRIAASRTGAPGDGDNARDLAAIRAQALVGGATLNDYYNGMISRLGVDTAAAMNREEGARLLKEQVNLQRQSVAGVSVDEETTNLLRYQHAYAAAARYIAAVDEMLRTLTENLS